jgi:hypothetical protein
MEVISNMIEAGKWYKTDSDEDGNMAMYYYIFLTNGNDVYCAAMFDDGEIFEFEVYHNFGHDSESQFIPPYEGNLNQMAFEVLFEHYGDGQYIGDLI